MSRVQNDEEVMCNMLNINYYLMLLDQFLILCNFDQNFVSYERRLILIKESADTLCKAQTVEEQKEILSTIERIIGKGMRSLFDVSLTPTNPRLIDKNDLNNRYLDAVSDICCEIRKLLDMPLV